MKWVNYKRGNEWHGDDIAMFPHEINRIVGAFEILEQVRISAYEAAELWCLRSLAYDSGFLTLPAGDDDIIKDIKEFVKGFEIVDSEKVDETE